ncbi:MAG: methyltransferase domain-containing protein [Deltaproteobacteria bacterium]|nr:methyltransferase domain-containing protein [Deltaproteobacteria bacterium]
MDKAKRERFISQVMDYVTGASLSGMIYIGDRVGLFKAMAGAGPLSVAETAAKAGLQERYVREWLSAMAAAGIVTYDAAAERFTLPEEHAAVLADENSPSFLGGFFQNTPVMLTVAPRVADAFVKGGGVPFSDYGPDLVAGIDRSNRAQFQYHLVKRWLPAMPEVVARLEVGARAADIGCGSGYPSILMAQAFPRSRFYGFDVSEESLERARADAQKRGVADRVEFQRVSASALPESPKFDFITSFDAIHDMVDPRGAVRAIRRALADDGTYMMVEVKAGETLAENLNPLGAMMYSISTLHCLTVSLAHGGEGIGTLMGERKARELAEQAGFTHFRRLPIEHAFNVFYEIRP